MALPFPEIDPIAIQIGPVAVRWYGLAYAAGFFLGWAYIMRLVARPALWGTTSRISSEAVDDLLTWIIVGVVIGGRLGHVLLYQPSVYLADPIRILWITEGGMAFHGGLLGVAVAILWVARRHGLDKWSLGDLVAAAVPIGIGLGRVANFINAEIVGSVTDVPWAFVFPGWGPEPRHPAMLYEAVLEGLVLFLALAWLVHHRRALAVPGRTTGWFLAGYAAARLFAELFKIMDHRLIVPDLPVTKGMVYSLPMLIAGIWLIAQARRHGADQGAISGTAGK